MVYFEFFLKDLLLNFMQKTMINHYFFIFFFHFRKVRKIPEKSRAQALKSDKNSASYDEMNLSQKHIFFIILVRYWLFGLKTIKITIIDQNYEKNVCL